MFPNNFDCKKPHKNSTNVHSWHNIGTQKCFEIGRILKLTDSFRNFLSIPKKIDFLNQFDNHLEIILSQNLRDAY